MRTASTYRAAKRNDAKSRKLVWRDLPRRIGKQNIAPGQTVLDRFIRIDAKGEKHIVAPEVPRGLQYGTLHVVMPWAAP